MEKKALSRQNESFEVLRAAIEETEDPAQEEKIGRIILLKALAAKDHSQCIYAYNVLLYLEKSYKGRLMYADSILLHSEHLSKREQAEAKIIKGAVHYSAKKYVPALANYLKAKNLLETDVKDGLYYKNQYCIAQVKYYLGYYKEAVKILSECASYYSTEESRGYINCLHMLGLCYNRTGEYQQSYKVNQQGISEASKMQETGMLPYFLHCDGINHFFLKKYDEALKNLESTLPFLENRNDYANASVSYYYIGNIHEKKGRHENALESYRKVYSIFKKHHYIRHDLAPAIAALAKESKRTGNISDQLQYTAAMFSADSLLHTDFRHLSRQLHDHRIASQNKSSTDQYATLRWLMPTAVFSAIAVIIVIAYFRNRNRKPATPPDISGDQTVPPVEIPRPETPLREGLRADLAEKLEKFELDKKYLLKDMNLEKMSKILGTNPKYVSRIIKQERGKKTTQYLNELKIKHLVNMFRENRLSRRYSHRALADEIGFSATKTLLKVFSEQMDVSLQEFLDSLPDTEDPDKDKQSLYAIPEVVSHASSEIESF